jgi:hypothetical protein
VTRARALGLIGGLQDALLVFGCEVAATRDRYDFGIGAGVRIGAGSAVSGTPVAIRPQNGLLERERRNLEIPDRFRRAPKMRVLHVT